MVKITRTDMIIYSQEPNFKCFDSRVGQHKDRLGNAFFLYTVMLEAISKLEPYIRQYTWCSGDQLENMKTRVNLIIHWVDVDTIE